MRPLVPVILSLLGLLSAAPLQAQDLKATSAVPRHPSISSLSASHDVAQDADALGPAFDAASSDEQQDLLTSRFGGGGQPVPEPGTLLLVGSGLVGVAVAHRMRRRRS